jgi:hypothetical protein
VRRLWGITRVALQEAIRTRTALAILIVLVIVVALGPFLLHGTGSLIERVQLVLNYTLSAVGFLLSLLTIFLATSSIAGDLRDKRIETVATKPIARWQILVGKWLAVMILNVVLLAASGVAAYVLVRLVIGNPAAAPTAKERRQLNDELYVARHTVDPIPPEFDAAVDKRVAQLRKAGQWPEGMSTAEEEQRRRTLRTQLQTMFNTLGPGSYQLRPFRDVRPARSEKELFVRYKVLAAGMGEDTAPDNTITLQWFVSPVPSENDPNAIGVVTHQSMGDFHTFRVPASVASPDGHIFILIVNVDDRFVYAAFPNKEGVQVLYRAGGFGGNFVRTLLLTLCRLAFLSALAVAAASLLTFPVASLFVVFVFLSARSVNSFVALASPIGGPAENPVYQVPAFYRVVLRAISAVIPNFGRYDGTANIATGKLVSWHLVLMGLLKICLIYGGAVMVLGCFWFRRRELVEAE